MKLKMTLGEKEKEVQGCNRELTGSGTGTVDE